MLQEILLCASVQFRWLVLICIFACTATDEPATQLDQQQVKTRTLILIRHAKSSHDNPLLQDIDRPLNDRGKRDAPFMGQKLAERNLPVDYVVASPAKRTTETARQVCKAIGYDFEHVQWEPSIYLPSEKKLLEAIRKSDDQYTNVLVFGHNFSITDAANSLQSDTSIANVVTCGMVSISFDVASWQQVGEKKGRFNFYDYPKRYSKGNSN